MIKNPSAVRDRVLADVLYTLKHLHSMLTFLPETEHDVLLCLERDHDLSIDLTNFLMARFGHETKPKEPRFDKTRRRLAKKPKPPRGVNTYNNSAERQRMEGT